MSLPCWIKWALSLVAGPGVVVLGLVVFVLVVSAFFYGFERAVKWLLPDANTRERVGNILSNPKYFPGHWRSGLFSITFVWGLLGVMIYMGGAAFMQATFGCDACLPAFMQKTCEVAKASTVANDRADFERLCYAHPGWCVRIPTSDETESP